ncbi:MAG: hypothetical protein ACRESA_01370, partial [Gammaproteobacteria bacterium]
MLNVKHISWLLVGSAAIFLAGVAVAAETPCDQFDAQMMERYGFSEQQACSFLSVGTTDLGRTYGIQGFNYNDAVAWAKAGFTGTDDAPGDMPTAEDAKSWKDAGFSPAHAGILVKSYTSPDIILSLRNSGFTSDEISNWAVFAAKYRNNPPNDLAKQMISWKQAGFDPHDAASYSVSGLDVKGGQYAQKYCRGRFEQQDITTVNPYRVKNHCFVFNGEVVQLLNETTVLANEASSPGEQLLANTLGIATSNS